MTDTDGLREALERAWKALEADDRETETVPVGVKWLLELNEAVARLRHVLPDASRGEIRFYIDGKLSPIHTMGLDESFRPGEPPEDAPLGEG